MSDWIDTDTVCPHCSANTDHLLVDGHLLYCGRCDQLITDDYKP